MGEISPQLADNEAWVDQTFEKSTSTGLSGSGQAGRIAGLCGGGGQQSDAGGACDRAVGCTAAEIL